MSTLSPLGTMHAYSEWLWNRISFEDNRELIEWSAFVHGLFSDGMVTPLYWPLDRLKPTRYDHH